MMQIVRTEDCGWDKIVLLYAILVLLLLAA